ncbi:MAG: sigma-70 family RNA polymerase sigma factor [Bacteroidota bacterium]
MLTKIKYTEEELITLIKGGNQNAFSYLYDNYSKALFGVIYNIVGNDAEAEDILQNVFLKIWRNFYSYKEEKGRLFTWMLNIARNSAIDYTRSRQNKMNLKNYSSDNLVNEINKVHSNNVSYDHIGLKKVLTELKEDHQTIIDLAYYKGYTQVEIAQKLNLPFGTVKTKVRQAIITLRKKIK